MTKEKNAKNSRKNSYLNAVLSTTYMSYKIEIKYPGFIITDILLPLVISAIALLIGSNTGNTFQSNTGTADSAAYMLIGGNVFYIVSSALWKFSTWMRREQETGTLEALYLAPISRFWLLLGSVIYILIRNMITFILCFTIGCIIFRINPFKGNVILALSFTMIGLIPLYGISLLYGALILKIKDVQSIVPVANWLIGLLMGIFFPITLFPRLMQWFALLFPPTWMNNGIRASLLGVSWYFDKWYWDLAVLGALALIVPLLGYAFFIRTEKVMRRKEGIGNF